MELFGDDCPGDEHYYIVYHKDKNIQNNNVSNLEWMPKKTMATLAGLASTDRDALIKYHNIVVYYDDLVVAYFKDSNDMKWNLHKMGMGKNYSVSRLMALDCKLFNLFKAKEVSDEEYDEISMSCYNNNLKLIADIINLDRDKVGRTKKVVEYKEKIVYKPKIEKQIVEKIVYKEKADKKPIEEKIDKKPIKEKVDKPVVKKKSSSKIVKPDKKIDKLKDLEEPSFDEIMKLQEQQDREHFKNMLYKLGVGINFLYINNENSEGLYESTDERYERNI